MLSRRKLLKVSGAFVAANAWTGFGQDAENQFVVRPPGILIGGAVGAGSTGGHWLSKHRSATLPAGTELTLELNRPLAMTTSVANSGQ